MDNQKVCFLFGAGADSCYSKNLKSGTEFNKSLLTNGYKEQRKLILGDEIRNIEFVHHNSKKIFAQTIYYNQEEAKKLFGETIVDFCIKYYEDSKHNEALDEFFDNSRKSLFEENDNEEYKSFYLKYAQFFDSLDEKFNSLRFPNKKNNNAKRVINSYWIIFFVMLNWLYATKDKEYSFEQLVQLLDTDYNIKVEANNYYNSVKSSKIDCEIITSNYTSIAETVIGKDVTYLHGNLKWFEDLESLTVYDISNPIEREKAIKCVNKIPFILIPSGVKPVICRKQICEFNEFITKLDKCHELCVIGYRFNSEDNHINSIIGDWLRNHGNHMTFFDYDNNIDFSKIPWSNDFSYEKIDYDKEKTFFKDYNKQISLITAKESNFTKIFDEYVNLFPKQEEK